MRSLLIIMMLAALSACEEVAQEFQQVEEGVYVLGSEDGAEPLVVLQPEGESKILLESDQDEEANGVTRSNNFSQGTIGLWDIMLAHYNPLRQAIPNQVIVMDINYRGTAFARISFIRAIQASGQLANARVIAGGLGMNFAVIRLTSARGSGFQYSIDIWGR